MFGSLVTVGATIASITCGSITDFIGRKGVCNFINLLWPGLCPILLLLKIFQLVISSIWIRTLHKGTCVLAMPLITFCWLMKTGYENGSCFQHCRMACYLLCQGIFAFFGFLLFKVIFFKKKIQMNRAC